MCRAPEICQRLLSGGIIGEKLFKMMVNDPG